MRRNKNITSVVVSILTFVIIIALGFASCKKESNDSPTPGGGSDSPDPVNGELPESVLPAELYEAISEHFVIYSGDDPVKAEGQFVSKPHALIATSLDPEYDINDSAIFYNDRYICFDINSSGYTDFYGKQWDDDYEQYYEETFRNLKSVGSDDNFTCYYFTYGYPDGMYAKQSTIFSGRWDESYGGLLDFQVAVILLETSGNPNLEPKNSYRILGDYDGLAQDTAWMGKKAQFDNNINVSEHDAFWMFRKK